MSEKPRIVLAEDDREQAALFAQVLALAGYLVVPAANANDALREVATAPTALLLADWDLPGMKGDALIAAAKAQYPAVKTMLYSNHANVHEACIVCGADAWMRKTEGISRLRELVKGLVG